MTNRKYILSVDINNSSGEEITNTAPVTKIIKANEIITLIP